MVIHEIKNIKPQNITLLRYSFQIIQFEGALTISTFKLVIPQKLYFFLFFQIRTGLKEQCHEDFAVLGQSCAKIISLRL